MTTVQSATTHVQEAVATHQKTITVAALTAAVGISVRSSQQVLEKFRAEQEKNGVVLRCLYAVSGTLKASPEAGQAWKIVAKEELDATLAKFDKPHSEIYSVAPPDATNTTDIKGMMADLWAEDLARVSKEMNDARSQNGLWRPAHLPPGYCTPSASEKRELYIPGYSGGKPCPSPMKTVNPPGKSTKLGMSAASTFGRPAAKPANLPKAPAAKKVEETPMPDVSKVKITDKTPAVGEKRKAEEQLAPSQATKTKTTMSGGYMVMEDAPTDAKTEGTAATKEPEAAPKAPSPAPPAAAAAAPPAAKKEKKQMSMLAFIKKGPKK